MHKWQWISCSMAVNRHPLRICTREARFHITLYDRDYLTGPSKDKDFLTSRQMTVTVLQRRVSSVFCEQSSASCVQVCRLEYDDGLCLWSLLSRLTCSLLGYVNARIGHAWEQSIHMNASGHSWWTFLARTVLSSIYTIRWSRSDNIMLLYNLPVIYFST